MKWTEIYDGFQSFTSYYQSGFDYEVRVYGDSARANEWYAGQGGTACRTAEFRGPNGISIDQAKDCCERWLNQRKEEREKNVARNLASDNKN